MAKKVGFGDQTMDCPRPEHAVGGGVRRPRRAKGGNVHEYNASGSPTMAAAKDESEDDFARGGRGKRKAGGLAFGGAAVARADKPRRGRGGVVNRYAAGGKVWSSAADLKEPENGDKASRGHEGQEVGKQPGPG